MTDRECPMCGNENVCSVREAERIFSMGDWGETALLDDADRVCSVCHSARIDGTWERMESVSSRAWDLAQASSTKGREEYEAVLTRDTEMTDRLDTGPEERESVADAEW